MNSIERPPISVDAKTGPELKRLAYAAVPLDPWRAEHPSRPGVPYFVASLESIEEIADASFSRPGAKGLSGELRDLVKVALWGTQTQRVDYNHDHPIPAELRGSDPALERACLGTATPADLLDVFLRYPDMQSVELAKLTHPFDFGATDEMNNVITRLLSERLNSNEPMGSPRYRVKRLFNEIPAQIIVRKRDVDVIDPNASEFELCRVIERTSLLLRGDKEAQNGYDAASWERFGRILKGAGADPEKLSDLTKRIELQLANGIRPLWMQPLTTSYYIRRV